MSQAVEMAGWKKEEVELINAHGTSTPLNDKMETQAIVNAFGDHAKNILVNSTKSMIGHCLGAAGALELIAALQSIVEGIVHPTVNCVNIDPACSAVNVVAHGAPLEKSVDKLLVNSFGFGGHNAVLAVEGYKG
jgi:3-oxoacyl-[acyl-carrier-protein] synthase II